MEIALTPAYDHPQEVGALFAEYTQLLLTGDRSFQEYLDLQHYDHEVQDLAHKYGLPDGRLYLAYCDGAPAGCIGLRKIDGRTCEMKRLYVRPQFQGSGIGRLLAEQIIRDAKDIGYAQMLLDTLPFLKNALRLYERLGFYPIDRYNDSPMSTSIYMGLDL